MPVFVLGLSSCKKKEEGNDSSAPTAATPDGSDKSDDKSVEAPAPKPVVLTADERAEFLGFAKHLPQDTEVVMSLLNGSNTMKRVMSSKLWQAIGIGPAAPTDDDMELLNGPAALFAQEFTLAFGNGTDEQTSHLLKLNSRSNYYQMKSLVEAFAKSQNADQSFNVYDLFGGLNDDIILQLAQDPDTGLGLYEKLSMPPVYVAFRTAEGNRDEAAMQLEQTVNMMTIFDELVEPLEFKVGEAEFRGYKIPGAQTAKMMMEERAELEESLPVEVVDRLIEATSKKDIIVISGLVGEYAVMFIGSSVEQFKIADSADDSLLGTDALAFCDAYASNEFGALVYGQDGALKEMVTQVKGGVGDMAAGARDGLAGSDELGDTRNLEALLRMVQDREDALYSLYSAAGGGTVLFFDDGMKIESFGGFDSGIMDWEATNQMASLGDGEDVVMFANMTTDVVYDEKMREYLEAMMETLYMATMKVSELPDPDGDMGMLKNYTQMFDTKFRPYLLTFWEGFSGGFNGSIGSERAWVMDLKGAMPTLPGIPQVMVDEGKFPRMSIVAPVVDRSKLGDSWEKMNTGLTGMLGNVSEMMGEDIPMQKPISSEKDGFTTWFFGMPFFSDDFMPSVTVGDEWFTASTSKNQAIDLLQAAKAGGKTSKGAFLSFDFKAMDSYMEEMIVVIKKNQEELDLSDDEVKQMEKFGKGLDDLDELTVHVRRENGQLRSSVHLKTR